jgi:hypothetical protein
MVVAGGALVSGGVSVVAGIPGQMKMKHMNKKLHGLSGSLQ